MLNLTHPSDLCDPSGRLRCFSEIDNLKDWTVSRCLADLRHVVPGVRGTILGSLMEHARPDDLFLWVPPLQVLDDWPEAERSLAPGGRFELWSLIVRRLNRRYLGPAEGRVGRRVRGMSRFPAREGGSSGKAGRPETLALALLELWLLRKPGNLVAVWLALEEGGDLKAALLRMRSVEPALSVFELVELLLGIDLAPAQEGPLFEEAVAENLPPFRDHLAERMLDLVLQPLLVSH